MPWKEVGRLSVHEFVQLLKASNVLEAQEQMLNFDSEAFGMADRKGREKIFKRYHKQAHPNKHSGEALDLKQIQKMINSNKALMK